ncbi:MAG: thioredoxin [Bacilli bacterium]|nr:thioredoxin [Bacilli bacterium]
MGVIVLNEDNFEEEVLKSNEPVLVDFFATWCGPCQMMSPILDKMSEEEKGIKICKIDTDDNMNLAKEYGIMTIPCIIAFKDGKELNRSIGLTDEKSLLKLLED